MPSFGAEINTGNITENWLFKLANRAGGFIYLAFTDTTYSSKFWHGVITNKPSIRESIDLANSTAKTSNVSINIPDFKYQGNPISQELFGGANQYINQPVSVYAQINGITTQIGSFRLIDISSDGNKLNISMTSHRPWDFISFPQSKSTVAKILAPIAYGDFTQNTNSTYASPQYINPTNLDYRPIPYNNNRSGKDYFISHDEVFSKGDAEIAVYDKSLKTMLPLEDSGEDTVTEDGVDACYAVRPNLRGFKQTGISTEEVADSSYTGNSYGNVPWVDMNNAIDKNNSNVATYTTDAHGTYVHNVGHGNALRLNLERPDGTLVQGIAKVKYDLIVTLPSSPYYHNSDHITLKVKIIDSNGDTTESLYVYSAASGTYVATTGALSNLNKTVTITYGASDSFPEYVDFYVEVVNNNQNNSGSNYFVTWVLKAQEFTSISQFKSDDEEQEEILFIGANGYRHGITDIAYNNTLITTIQEAHLDLLNRFGGFDSSDLAADVDGWDDGTASDLQSDRSTWAIRWWQLEPIELKKALIKLQYEGGFIFRYKADGNPQYIHIKDSNTVTATLTKADIKSVQIKPSPFSELLTKMEVSYEKHPAENRYITSKTAYADTERTNWNIQAKENIQQVNLDAYVAPAITEYDDSPLASSSSPNDDFFAYYYNIFGDIKIIVSATIVNPKYYNLDVGAVIAFSDMYPEKPFGYNSATWTGIKFMITSISRTAGSMKFEAREIEK